MGRRSGIATALNVTWRSARALSGKDKAAPARQLANKRIARIEEERRIEKETFVELQNELVRVRSAYEEEVKALNLQVDMLMREKDAMEQQMKEATKTMNSPEESISGYVNLMKAARSKRSRRRTTFINKLQAELFKTVHKLEVVSNQNNMIAKSAETTEAKTRMEAELRVRVDNLLAENDALERNLRYKQDEIDDLKMTVTVLTTSRDAAKDELKAVTKNQQAVERDLAKKLKLVKETISVLTKVNKVNDNVIAKLYCEMGAANGNGTETSDVPSTRTVAA